jgi:hypothetical protein
VVLVVAVLVLVAMVALEIPLQLLQAKEIMVVGEMRQIPT